MNSPYISVVIPTYNRARFIVSAIESVLTQKNVRQPYEIVVVDDGSTDNTEEALTRFKNKIRFFKIRHTGLPAVVRNFGIARSRGELIAFQDSDDLWPNYKLSRQTPLFENPNIVMVYGQAESINSDGKKLHKKVVDPGKLNRGEAFETLLQENVISTLTTMVRKSTLDKLGGFNDHRNLQAVEDYELWLRIAANFPNQIKSMGDTLAYYRVHDQNISSANSSLALERLIRVYDKLWQTGLPNSSQYELLEEQISTMQENWSRQQNIDGNTPKISVVMGIYRDKFYVKGAVESILNQSFKDFEFIIIDDGSSDGSYDEVAKFKDSRIRLIRQNNHGLVSVLNKGARLARADLIARQDADDISKPERFEKEIKAISTNPRLAVVGAFFRYVDEETLKPTGVTITSLTKHIDIARHMYFDNPIGHGTALIRKEALEAVGGYNDNYGPNEDYDLWRRLVGAGWIIQLIPEVLYLYRLSSKGISSTKSEVQHRFFAELLKEYWSDKIQFKPFWKIISDSWYYKHLDSPFRKRIHKQYKSQQFRLTFEFLTRGHLLNGYNNFLGAIIISPRRTIKLWKTLLWAPIKYMREFR